MTCVGVVVKPRWLFGYPDRRLSDLAQKKPVRSGDPIAGPVFG